MSNNFNIILNRNTKFFKRKKTIILLVRKSPGEIDFILPILYQLRENFNVFTIFIKKQNYIKLKNNKKLFNLWKKTSFGLTYHPDKRYMLLRLTYKVHEKIKKKFIEKYYNFEDLTSDISKKLNIHTNNIIDIKSIFCSFGNSSYWTDLGKQKQDCKILYFPDRTNLDYNKPFKKFTNSAQPKIKFNKNELLLVPNIETYKKYKKKFNFNNFYFTGYPKLNKYWINKIFLKQSKKISKNKITIFFKDYNRIIDIKYQYYKQIESIFTILKKYNLKANFNLHPYARDNFIKYVKKYKKKYWVISQRNMFEDINQSTININMYGANSILDVLALNKYPIELWSVLNNKFHKLSIYRKNNLSVYCKNDKELDDNFKKLLNKKKYSKIDASKKIILKDHKNLKNIKIIVKEICRFINAKTR